MRIETAYARDASDVDSALAQPNQPPVASVGGPYSGVANQAVTFDGSGSSDPDGDPLTYQWTFGDGATGSGVTPTHVYAASGSYTAMLVVSDGMATSSTSTTPVTIVDPAITVTTANMNVNRGVGTTSARISVRRASG